MTKSVGQQDCPSWVHQVYSGSTVQDSGLPTWQGPSVPVKAGGDSEGMPRDLISGDRQRRGLHSPGRGELAARDPPYTGAIGGSCQDAWGPRAGRGGQ